MHTCIHAYGIELHGYKIHHNHNTYLLDNPPVPPRGLCHDGVACLAIYVIDTFQKRPLAPRAPLNIPKTPVHVLSVIPHGSDTHLMQRGQSSLLYLVSMVTVH